MVVYIAYVHPLVSHVPSNGLSPLSGVSVSSVPYKRLDELCSMCSMCGRVATGGYVSTGLCVRYSVAVAVALWGCGDSCGAVVYWPMVTAVAVAVSTGGLVYAVISLTKHLNDGNMWPYLECFT